MICMFVTLAQGQMNLGFYELESPSIPKNIQESSVKIFKITVPYYSYVNDSKYDVVLNSQKAKPELKRLVQKCKEAKKLTCIVPLGTISGTAFLDESPDHIWTNCHIVREWMKHAAQDQNFVDSKQMYAYFLATPVPLVLNSVEGQTVYSQTEKAFVKAFIPEGTACSFQDDLVKIKLSKPLAAEGLMWGKPLTTTKNVFLGGFPMATETRESVGKQDSDGQQFYWTFGDTIDFKNANDQKYLAQKPNIEFATSGTYLHGLLADGVEGMSGSPVLNEKAEVIGIYKGFIPWSMETKDTPFVSLFIDRSGMRFVEIFSGE